jgi:hypothetical protein
VPSTAPGYLEIIDFIAGGTTPEAVIAFRPSEQAEQRVAELIEAQKQAALSPAEAAELNHCIELEHILRLAKATARKKLAGVRP